MVHQNQHLLYSVDFKSGEPLQQKIGLNIDTFPTGIVQFSLFTCDWLPLAERIVFVNNQLPEFNAKVSITNSDLNKRGKNTIEVQVADTIEAMSTHRPYRPALGLPAAIDEIKSLAGVKLDKEVVDAAVRLFEGKDSIENLG